MHLRRFLILAAVSGLVWLGQSARPLQSAQAQFIMSAAAAASVPAAPLTNSEVVRDPSPLFIQNNGQFDSAVRFQRHAAEGVWWLTDAALWLTVAAQPDPASVAAGADPLSESAKGVNLRLTFVGMSPAAHLAATDPQPTTMNYFVGNDPAKWRSAVPTFGAARWEAVFPDTDILITGLGLQVQPRSGATLPALRLRVEGADAMRLETHGRVVVETAVGTIQLPAVLSSAGQRLLPTLAGDTLTFGSVEVAMATAPEQAGLDNDPGDLIYSTFLGGSNLDRAYGIAVGADGSAYVAGATDSVNFPTTPGAFDNSLNGGKDVFVARLTPDGDALVYSTYLGGSGDDCIDASLAAQACALALGAEGNVYLFGLTTSTNFPTTPGAFDTTYNGNQDDFVTQMNADGSALVYSTYLGGSARESNNSNNRAAMVVDPSGGVYVSSDTTSTDFPTTPGAFDTSYNGNIDAYITKLNAAGNALVYSSFLGGSNFDAVGDSGAIALGSDGALYMAGSTNSVDFPTAAGSFDTSYNGGAHDAFVSKFNADGSALVYSTFLGGSQEDRDSLSVVVNAAGQAYIVGGTMSSDFPVTPGAFDTSYNGGSQGDNFITKLDADGAVLVYSTFLGGSSDDNGGQIAVNQAGELYLFSTTMSSNFPTTPGAYDTSHNGGYYDGTLSRLDAGGSSLVYSTYLGGSAFDFPKAMALDANGRVYMAGETRSSNFPTTPGAFDTSYNGGQSDAFVSKLNPEDEPPIPPVAISWTTRAEMPTGRGFLAATTTSAGEIYAVGGQAGNFGNYFAATEVYDPATDTWMVRAGMAIPRYGLGVATAGNDRIYAMGGETYWFNSNLKVAATEEYDPASDTWVRRARMFVRRMGLGVATAANGKIYAIGGTVGRSGLPVATVEEYDPATNVWAIRASMPTARIHVGVAAGNNGKIYAIGGYDNQTLTAFDTVEEYDPVANTWTTRASMPTARGHLAVATAADGKIYAVGGYRADTGALAAVEEYDPATDTWRACDSMPTLRFGLAVAIPSNGKIYAIGGFTANYATGLRTVEEGAFLPTDLDGRANSSGQ